MILPMGLHDRFPTLRGFAYFFYVATHWGTLSQELDAYRKQIKDRDAWLEAMQKAMERQENLAARERNQLIEDQRKLAEALNILATELDQAEKKRDTAEALLREGRDLLNRTMELAQEGSKLTDEFSKHLFALIPLAVRYLLQASPEERSMRLAALPEPIRSSMGRTVESLLRQIGPPPRAELPPSPG